MKHIILATMVSLSLLQTGSAQTNADKPVTNNATSTAQQATAQSPELVEAGQLSVQSVKLYGSGKYDEAIALGKRALQIREQALGSKHPLVASSLVNIAHVYTAKKEFQEAIDLYQRALEIYENESPPDQQKASGVLRSIGLLYASRGVLYKAEEYLGRALTKLEEALGKENPGLVVTLYLLAELHHARGIYEKAEPFYQRALAIKDKETGTNSSDGERIRARYACLLWKTERPDEARKLGSNELGNLYQREKQAAASGEPALINVINGKALSLPKPTYPEEAKAARVTGMVTVGVVIDETGTVIQACALKGHRLLAEAAENAARKARFTPTSANGQPIRVTGTVSYHFVR